MSSRQRLDRLTSPRGVHLSSNQVLERSDHAASLEHQVAGILSNILGIAPEAIPRQESFLSYGCDSIVLVTLAVRINENFGVALTVFQLFELSTLEALIRYLSGCVREARSTKASDGQQSSILLRQRRQRVGAEAILSAATQSRERSALAESEHHTRTLISYGQRLFWRLAIRAELASYFNLRLSMILRGPLHVPALHASLQELVNRHDALRLHFVAADPSDPDNVELIVPARATPTFTMVELERDAAFDPMTIVAALLQREIEEPFDLFGEPLVRFKLVRFGPTMHAFLITIHHLITDQWSLNILKQELLRLYAARSRGQVATLPELPLQFSDYAEWTHMLHRTESYRAQLHYWDELFTWLGPFEQNACASLRDPAAVPATGYADLSIAEQEVWRIAARGTSYGTTSFVLLQSVMHLALYSMFPGLKRMLTLSPVAERHHPELQHSIGMYLTIVGVVSTIPPGMTLQAFVAHIKRSVHEALETAEARQFAVYDLSKRRGDDFPLFVYNYLVLPNDGDWAWEGLRAEPVVPAKDTRPFITMLELYHGRSSTGLWGALKYDTSQLNGEAIAQFSVKYRRILEMVLTGSDDMPVAKLIAA